MVWWNESAFVEGWEPDALRELDYARFPDGEEKWSADPGCELLRAIGARNILQAYYLANRATGFRNRILKTPWLVRTAPLCGITRGCRRLWAWFLEKATVCPVFVPGVSQQGGRLIRFDIVFPKSGPIPAKVAVAARLAELRHPHSISAARRTLQKLEPDLSGNWLVLADDRGVGTCDVSGSLGIALAAWAVQMQAASGAHEALPALAGEFSVTGVLAPDGFVKRVGGLSSKTDLASERRQMIVPYAQSANGAWIVQANTWGDAKALIAPRYTGGERGEFPACDVLIGFSSEQTEPHLKFVAELKPRKAIIIFHSDDKERSLQPACRIKECLELNAGAWGGNGIPIRLGRVDSERPHLIEWELMRVVDELCGQGIPLNRIVIQIAGGNKMMAIAAANVARKGCILMYLELRTQKYSVINNDQDGRLRQVSFVEETSGVLDARGFHPDSVEKCMKKAENRKA